MLTKFIWIPFILLKSKIIAESILDKGKNQLIQYHWLINSDKKCIVTMNSNKNKLNSKIILIFKNKKIESSTSKF